MASRGTPAGFVKNRQPAEQQITAEQILREAKGLQLEDSYQVPKQIITDREELNEYRLRERKKFEDNVRRVGRFSMGIWVKYAGWEEKQRDFRRARNVFERALTVNQHHLSFWIKYVEMEMRNGMVNHARNVFERATNVLPRVHELWKKWTHMEEMMKQIGNARQTFEKWMRWEPDERGWNAYIKFELRGNEIERARSIYERYVACWPSAKSWIQFAKFEAENGELGNCRDVYERALEIMEEEGDTENLFIKFAEFEEFCKEHERARAIYKLALSRLPKDKSEPLYERFLKFEKQHGSRDNIDEALGAKRRLQFEEQLEKAPFNYDVWFDYIKLEQSMGGPEEVRAVFQRAVANAPPTEVKLHWSRYVYFWISWAVYEELEVGEPARAREVYRACLKTIPHNKFTFAKVWILAAKLELRQKRLGAARTILGMAIGKAPKPRLFKFYIDLETQLAQVDRVRELYGKFLEHDTMAVHTWIMFAELEQHLHEVDRARSIHELALSQPVLNQPEVLWMHYIDFEIEQGNRENVRALYERLLERTQHVKVWVSYAHFEGNPVEVLAAEAAAEEDESDEQRAARLQAVRAAVNEDDWAVYEAASRNIFSRGFTRMRENEPDAKAEAAMLLQTWLAFERGCVSTSGAAKERAVAAVQQKVPTSVKKRRQVTGPDGSDQGMEEYIDYVFPDEDKTAPLAKLLAAAERWKKQKVQAPEAGEAAS